jgi:hypothetical protein
MATRSASPTKVTRYVFWSKFSMPLHFVAARVILRPLNHSISYAHEQAMARNSPRFAP